MPFRGLQHLSARHRRHIRTPAQVNRRRFLQQTENRQLHMEVQTQLRIPGKRLGLQQEAFNRAWSNERVEPIEIKLPGKYVEEAYLVADSRWL